MQTVLEPSKRTPTKRWTSPSPQAGRTSAPPLESPLEQQIRIGAIPKPIDSELVRSEKKRLLHEARLACGAPGPLRYLWVRNVGVVTGVSTSVVSAILANVHVVTGSYTLLSTIGTGVTWGVVFSHALATIGLFMLAGVMLGVAAVFDNYPIPSWKRREYHDFAGNPFNPPVPKEVENLAGEIEARVPEAYLFVDRLVHTTDPFFGVRYRGKDYFLVHWD